MFLPFGETASRRMTTLVIVRIRNCTIKFFCCLRSTRFDIFIEHSNILSALPKFVSYQMSDWLSEEIVHCNNLENKKKNFERGSG